MTHRFMAPRHPLPPAPFARTRRGSRRVAAWAGAIAVAAAWALLSAPGPAWAGGIGLDLIQNETERSAHADVPGSVASSIVRQRIFAFWHHQFDEDKRLNVDVEQEAYTLESASGEALVDLTLDKLHPRYRAREERWAIDAGLLVIDVTRNPGVYARDDRDTDDMFVLPAAIFDLTPRPLLFRAGSWEEHEILPLDRNTYAITISRNFEVGAGYELTPSSVAWIKAQESRRFYPEDFQQDRSQVRAEYRLRDPLDSGEDALWREISGHLAQQQFPITGDRFLELQVESVLRFGAGGATHFLVPRLVLTDSFVVYREGALPETLLEQTVEDADALLRLKYEGFTRIGETPVFLAWGLTVEASLLQAVQSSTILHVKAEYTY